MEREILVALFGEKISAVKVLHQALTAAKDPDVLASKILLILVGIFPSEFCPTREMVNEDHPILKFIGDVTVLVGGGNLPEYDFNFWNKDFEKCAVPSSVDWSREPMESQDSESDEDVCPEGPSAIDRYNVLRNSRPFFDD